MSTEKEVIAPEKEVVEKIYSVTLEQLECMRHAIGWDQSTELAQLAWRNYYNTDSNDKQLEPLVEQGLMCLACPNYYMVTKEGARFLGVPQFILNTQFARL